VNRDRGAKTLRLRCLDRDGTSAAVADADLAQHSDTRVAAADDTTAVEREPMDAARIRAAGAEADHTVVVSELGLGDQARVLAVLH